MGGGNGQKSAMARERNREKQAAAKNTGGGKAGMDVSLSFFCSI